MSILQTIEKLQAQDLDLRKIQNDILPYVNQPGLYEGLIELSKRSDKKITLFLGELKLEMKAYKNLKSVPIDMYTPNENRHMYNSREYNFLYRIELKETDGKVAIKFPEVDKNETLKRYEEEKLRMNSLTVLNAFKKETIDFLMEALERELRVFL